MRFLLGLIFSLSFIAVKAQYAPAAGKVGSTAIYMDSSIIVGWASQCSVIRGWQNMSDTTLGTTTVGTQNSALGKADNNVVSLGDGGTAIVQFTQAITNGVGPDFAVFENAFDDYFLELAFVEVSSDGINYFRFPAHSLSQTDSQTTTFGQLEAAKLHNLAGKYRAAYGTPFDLEELKNTAGLDINHITHIKIIDVVGSIDSLYASFDSASNIINDPFPTPFPSGGFDLDAVGAMHLFVGIDKGKAELNIQVYPNPAHNQLTVICQSAAELHIYSIQGKLVLNQQLSSGTNKISISHLPKGAYVLRLQNDKQFFTKQFIKN